jgi:hypothetical protein
MQRTREVLLAAAIVMIGIGTPVSAEPPPFFGCGSTGCLGVFGSIYIEYSGVVRITVPDGVDKTALQCTLYGNQYVTLRREHAGFKEIYSTILAAQVAQKNVYLRTQSGSPECEVLYAVSYP